MPRPPAISSWQTWCRALGLDFSPCLDLVEKANDVLARWFQITNTAAVWSGSVLKAIPYGDTSVTGNGYVFTPDVTPVYDLSDNDYVRPSDGDPVQLIRSDPNDAYNCYRLEFSDRTVLYNVNAVEARDQASIERFGLRVASQISAHEFTQGSVAQVAANLICQRSVNIRNTYTFKLSWEYFLLEPMDLVTLTDTGMGMTKVAVRITSVEEDDNGILTVVAEEFPSGTASATAYPAQANSNGVTINPAAVPAPVNPPVIFEPPASLTGGTAQVWIAASGGSNGVADPNWGGCNVWLSVDGTDYEMAGIIQGPARMGVLTAGLAAFSGGNPDTGDTLAVDLSMSAGTLSSGTAADAAASRTLCWCDGELLAFETATLTATGKYSLTTLYRGLYGTSAGAHASGAQFVRLDQAVFRYDLPQAYVGQAITVKLQSFNVWGGGVQDLSTCTAYSYTPKGTGFPLLNAAGTYAGLTVNASGQITAATSAGMVTSVGLSMPPEFSVTGSPVTSTGTLAVAKAGQNPNLVYAGPQSGTAAAPGFRALVAADLPASGATAGTYGDAGDIPVVTVDAAGRVTSIHTVAATGGGSSNTLVVANGAPVTLEPAGTLYSRADGGGGLWQSQVASQTGFSIVQKVASYSDSGDPVYQLATSPTPGNWLVLLASHYHNSIGVASGWSEVLHTNGNASGTTIAVRQVQSGDGTTWTPTTGNGGAGGILFEVAGLSATWSANPDISFGLVDQNASPTGTFASGTTATQNAEVALVAVIGQTSGNVGRLSAWTAEGSAHGSTYSVVGGFMPSIGNAGSAISGSVTFPASTSYVVTGLSFKLSVGSITTEWTAITGSSPYDIAGYLPGLPSAGQVLFRIEMVRAVTLPAGLAGSRAVCQTAPTNAVTLGLKQNGTAIGSIAFAAGATAGTFNFTNQVVLAAGDVLELDAPSPADATFAGPSYTITGTR